MSWVFFHTELEVLAILQKVSIGAGGAKRFSVLRGVQTFSNSRFSHFVAPTLPFPVNNS